MLHVHLLFSTKLSTETPPLYRTSSNGPQAFSHQTAGPAAYLLGVDGNKNKVVRENANSILYLSDEMIKFYARKPFCVVREKGFKASRKLKQTSKQAACVVMIFPSFEHEIDGTERGDRGNGARDWNTSGLREKIRTACSTTCVSSSCRVISPKHLLL